MLYEYAGLPLNGLDTSFAGLSLQVVTRATDFDTGLRRTVEWYLTHRDWWGHILSGEYQNYFQAMYRERLGE